MKTITLLSTGFVLGMLAMIFHFNNLHSRAGIIDLAGRAYFLGCLQQVETINQEAKDICTNRQRDYQNMLRIFIL